MNEPILDNQSKSTQNQFPNALNCLEDVLIKIWEFLELYSDNNKVFSEYFLRLDNVIYLILGISDVCF